MVAEVHLNELKHYDEDVLVHFGVKGMKWGVRKSRMSSDSSSLPAHADVINADFQSHHGSWRPARG